jgi:citrate lyase subunit beta/citryl-CoA lyase
VWPGLKRINYPKAETAREIWLVDRIISRLESERGIPAGHVEIGANVETALGVANALEIAAASPRITDFGGGGGYDMSRDLGVEMFVDFDQFVYGSGELELAARVAGLEIHSTPHMPNLSGSVSDGDHAFRVASATRKLGFRMGGGLHPNVVEPQNQGFTPTAAEVGAARKVLELYEEMYAAGKAWAEIDGVVVDWYEARRARELLDWAAHCARRNRDKEEAVAKAMKDANAS